MNHSWSTFMSSPPPNASVSLRMDTKCTCVSLCICQFSARRRGGASSSASVGQQQNQQQNHLQQQLQQQALRNQESNDSYFSNLLRKATAPLSTDEDFDFESPFS